MHRLSLQTHRARRFGATSLADRVFPTTVTLFLRALLLHATKTFSWRRATGPVSAEHKSAFRSCELRTYFFVVFGNTVLVSERLTGHRRCNFAAVVPRRFSDETSLKRHRAGHSRPKERGMGGCYLGLIN